MQNKCRDDAAGERDYELLVKANTAHNQAAKTVAAPRIRQNSIKDLHVQNPLRRTFAGDGF